MKCVPHEFRCPCKHDEDNEFLGVEVKGGSEVSDMGAGNQAQALWKTSKDY